MTLFENLLPSTCEYVYVAQSGMQVPSHLVPHDMFGANGLITLYEAESILVIPSYSLPLIIGKLWRRQ